MKDYGKSIVFIFFVLVTFFTMNKEVLANLNYGSELVNYSETLGVKQYTYDLYVNLTDSTKVNHFEGKLHLTNLEVISFTAQSGFVGSLNSSTLRYNLTSNKTYTSSTGKLVYARVVVKSVDSALKCAFEYEPSSYQVVPTNTFSIDKQAYKDGIATKSVKAGETFQYRITVRSANNVLATENVVVTDIIPNELEILSVSNGGTISGRKVTWDLGSFAPGEREDVLTINVKAKEGSRGTINNIAILTCGDNSFSDEEPVDILYSQLMITKKASRTALKKGEEFYYSISVRNIGTGSSENVTVEDTLDSDLEFISSPDGVTQVGNKLVFDLGIINKNETKTVRINVKVKENHSKYTITNIAIAKENGKNPLQSAVDVAIGVEETILPDVAISKKASVKKAKKGEEFTYTITVKNKNNLDLIDLMVKDVIDANLEFVSSNEEFTYTNGTYSWTLDLKGNETKEIVVKVKVKKETTADKVLNTAILTFEDQEISSEEVVVTIVPDSTPTSTPTKPEPDDPPIPIDPDKPIEIENPQTGNIENICLISIGFMILLNIIYYVKKNGKFYKI